VAVKNRCQRSHEFGFCGPTTMVSGNPSESTPMFRCLVRLRAVSGEARRTARATATASVWAISMATGETTFSHLRVGWKRRPMSAPVSGSFTPPTGNSTR
jgi:hypothetical protein